MKQRGPERRVDDTITEIRTLRSELRAHVTEESGVFKQLERDVKCLHDAVIGYKPYLEMAIKREGRREKFQNAVIEKAFIGMIWAALVGIGVLFWDGAVTHFKSWSGK